MLFWRLFHRFIGVLSAFAILASTALGIQGIARADGPAADPGGLVTAQALTGINVRSGPGLEYDRVGALAAGQQVTLDGRSGDWFRFTYPGSPVEGWVFGPLVKVTGDPGLLPEVQVGGDTDLPVLTPPLNNKGVPEPQPGAAVVATALADMVIRGGPGTKYEVFGSLEKGKTVVLDGRSGDWYRFSYPNSSAKGWLSRRFLSITGDVSKLLNVTDAP